MKPPIHLIHSLRWLGTAAWLWTGISLGVPMVSCAAPLQWDAKKLVLQAEPGASHVAFAFRFINQSAGEVVIQRVTPSCGCTMMNSLPLPWTVNHGARGLIEGQVDVQGKHGLLKKTIMLETSQGSEMLEFEVAIPEALGERRENNIKLARADRQAVFKGECATCHAKPAKGLTGTALYTAACAPCHESEQRASMVPALDSISNKDAMHPAYWDAWIRAGRPGSLMPAFAESNGGPLDDPQIESLVSYLVARFAVPPLSDD